MRYYNLRKDTLYKKVENWCLFGYSVFCFVFFGLLYLIK